MPILIAIASFLAFTLVTLWVDRVFKIRPCPVCVGVSGTWLWLTPAVLAGVLPEEPYILIIALLMGASVVGIADQAEKRIAWVARHSVKAKSIVIAPGIALGFWALANLSWTVWLLEVFLMSILAWRFFFQKIHPAPSARRAAPGVTDLEKNLDQCC